MVAQQIALRHPRRVRSLVLGATTPGGRRARLADDEVMTFFHSRAQRPREEAAWASVAYNYGRRCREEHADRIAEDIRRRLADKFDEAAYQAQLMAAALHNCTSRLGRIKVPALVVHGEDDRVVPVDNAHLIASRLRHGRLHLLRGHGPPLHDRGARRPTPRSGASSRPSPKRPQELEHRLVGARARRWCRGARRRRARAARAPAIAAASARPFAGGTIRSSAPCTTSVGAAIAPEPRRRVVAHRGRELRAVAVGIERVRAPAREVLADPRAARAARALAVDVGHGRPAALLVGHRGAAREEGERLGGRAASRRRRPRRSRRARAHRRAPDTAARAPGRSSRPSRSRTRARARCPPRRARRPRPRPCPRSSARPAGRSLRPEPRLSNVTTRQRAREHGDGAPPGVAREAEAHDEQDGRPVAGGFEVEHAKKFT